MITTIKFKDIIKYLAITTGIIVIVVFVARYFLNKKEIGKNEKQNNSIKKHTLISCINISIPISKTVKNSNNNSTEEKIERNSKSTSRSGLVRILNLELPDINSNEEITTEEDVKPTQEEHEKQEKIEVKDTYTNEYKGVKVKNLTDNIKLTESILKPDYTVKNKKNIIIYHTHTCESYTQTSKNTYKATGNYRTTDLNYSVVKVGDELEEELKKRGFNVVHDNTKHDYPAYTGSYSRSLETVEKLLKDNKNTDIVIDLHRDAVGSKGAYAPTVEINGEKVAQLMFVIGTNDGGGKHPNWKNNLKFAVKVQQKANEMYPGLFRAINLRSATFNQKVTNAATILEVGATGNTLEEAEASIKYFSEVLNKVLE